MLCDSFNVPLVRIMDTPGFVVGTDAERRGAPGHIMNFMNATCLTTVPQITVIARKAYGRAYVAMGGGAHNDSMVAWPTAEVSFMDPVFATNIVHNLSPGEEGFEDAFAHIQKDLEIWDMAQIFSAHDVIKPQETRAFLIRMFDVHRRAALRRHRSASHAHLADELLMTSRAGQGPDHAAHAPRAAARSMKQTRKSLLAGCRHSHTALGRGCELRHGARAVADDLTAAIRRQGRVAGHPA